MVDGILVTFTFGCVANRGCLQRSIVGFVADKSPGTKSAVPHGGMHQGGAPPESTEPLEAVESRLGYTQSKFRAQQLLCQVKHPTTQVEEDPSQRKSLFGRVYAARQIDYYNDHTGAFGKHTLPCPADALSDHSIG